MKGLKASNLILPYTNNNETKVEMKSLNGCLCCECELGTVAWAQNNWMRHLMNQSITTTKQAKMKYRKKSSIIFTTSSLRHFILFFNLVMTICFKSRFRYFALMSFNDLSWKNVEAQFTLESMTPFFQCELLRYVLSKAA